jgi:hypothetical protein
MTRKNKTTRSDQNRKQSFGRWLYKVVLFVFCGAVVYILFFSGLLSIASVLVKGTNELDQDEILGRISQELEGKYLGSFEKKNILLVWKGRLGSILKDNFKKIDSVDIEKKFPNTLLVIVHERKTALMLSGNPKNYLIDENGIAYEEVSADMLADNLRNFIVLKDTSEKPVDPDEAVLSREYIVYLQGIRDKMKNDLGIEVENKFETPSIVSDDARVITKEGWRVFFNPRISLRKELEMLKVFLDNKLEKNKRPDLEYVDLRADNKVFYKFKDGTPEASEGDEVKPDENSTDKNKPEVKGDSDKKGKKKKK